MTYVPPPPYARPPDGGQPWPTPPGYYPPGSAPGYAVAAPPPPRPVLGFGVLSAALAGFGALLLTADLLILPWYSLDGGLTTSDVRGRLGGFGAVANELSVAYFTWLGWLLVIVALGCALAAALPIAGLSLAFRIAGPIVAGFAALFTVGAAQLIDTTYGDDTYYLDHVSTGFWFALFGFACIGAGAIIGPRRIADPRVGSTAR
jgi:hypothetical protein